MTLRNQLKNVKIQNAKTMQSYFTRVSQIKEQPIAVKEKCEDLECRDHEVILYKGLSNQITTCSGKRRSEECSSGDVHLEWPFRIMGVIHLRNVCQKEVITFSGL